jgi:hypothetical protein
LIQPQVSDNELHRIRTDVTDSLFINADIIATTLSRLVFFGFRICATIW